MQKPPLNLHQRLHFLTKKHIFFAIYLLLLLALIQLRHQHKKSLISHEVTRTKAEDGSAGRANNKCDFSKGRWIRNKAKPIYNGTSCGTIKKGQNCMANGRPDTGYLHWRWQPTACELHPFHPSLFLTLIRNKHLAFIGDSLARNQLESLICLLSTVSQPELIYSSGDDNKFRRWAFPSHNATISIFWSPLLVKHVEKEPSLGKNHNKLYMDSVDERWARELDQIDIVVFSAGHWFLLPAIYHDSAGGAVLGCHYCPEFNHTEIGFFDIFRKSLRIALNEVKRRRRRSEKLVVLTTFSPAHFEGEWDKAGACSKMEPFKEGEKKMEYMDGEMRRIGVEEVRRGNDVEEEEKKNGRVKYEVVDVTELALMRGDGHPGAYMNPFPYAQGYKERLQNDCVHWCLPGPVDTWNEILLEIIKSWK
ncbi:putative PMR5 domain, PC-Esterase, trichome birefringence-like family [Dioscorea sansibarensis]